MRAVVCSLLVLCSAGPALAQSGSTLPRWDVSGSVGWLAGDKSAFAEDWNDWYDTFAASVDVGHYWSPHVKTEAGALFTTDGLVYSQQRFVRPNEAYATYFTHEHQFRVAAVTLAAAYQFFDNQWVHPFVSAGVQLTWEHERIYSPEQILYGRDPFTRLVVIPAIDRDEGWRLEVLPMAGAGAKFYVNERGFIRTDATVAWRDGGIGQVAWRAGIGIDF